MKIVVASDSYKGCLTSREVSVHMERAIHKVDPLIDVRSYVVGDGGEGTMEAFVSACNGTYVEVRAHDAYQRTIHTRYGLIEEGRTAVIEVANIIGQGMVDKEKRAPLYASSYGVGEVLAHARQRGCKKIILALGGSATNDGGMGLLEALGVRFYDQNGDVLKSKACHLEKIVRIDMSQLLSFEGIECITACDVKNPLLGLQGATHIFGKQKGLFPNQIKRIEKGMVHFHALMKAQGVELDGFEGGGAAGGIGAVSIALLGAKMQSGVALLFDYNNIAKDIEDCDLIITGEGQSDLQTMYGKVPVGVLKVAQKYHKPCVCISGALGVEYNVLYELGFIGIYSVADRAMPFAVALEHAGEKVEACTYSVVKTITYFIQT